MSDLALSGKDLLVQAKTGTGKTLAFLLPSIERLLKVPPRRGEGISILVISPTRELALQIEEEASTLLAHHQSFTVQHAIGGTNVNSEKNRLTKTPPTLLIATPGRLLDHLQTGSLTPDHFANVRFKRELDGILGYLPKRGEGRGRQALLFSATVSEEIKQVARSALRPDYTFVSTLLKDEINTHEHGDTVLSNRRHVSFAAALLEHIPGLPKVFEIHSRKSQSARGKAADGFKDAETGILICSDVVARGMDFPNVTLVMQLGLPSDSDQYIHRLGRTARAGAGGKGILILSPAERFFLSSKTIRDLPIKPHVMPASSSSSTTSIDSLSEAISAGFSRVPVEVKAAAYMSFMGYYNAHTKSLGWTKERLVEESWHYAQDCLGWAGGEPPAMEARTVGKMGLRGVSGLNIGAHRGGHGGGRGGGSGAGRGARSEGGSATPTHDVASSGIDGPGGRGRGRGRGHGRGRGRGRGALTLGETNT
ncbi:P-loop containing nucleoside triphosphate hydrolase protein [Infundibulicybe gibba]|nr:P-loop containing nucleoside triphosphate hydrolase protein [Infundibulicybe gibba]